jgi:hypothetical protein
MLRTASRTSNVRTSKILRKEAADFVGGKRILRRLKDGASNTSPSVLMTASNGVKLVFVDRSGYFLVGDNGADITVALKAAENKYKYLEKGVPITKIQAGSICRTNGTSLANLLRDFRDGGNGADYLDYAKKGATLLTALPGGVELHFTHLCRKGAAYVLLGDSAGIRATLRKL